MIAFLLLAYCLQNPDYQYGKPSDLKGLTRVYVDTGTDLKARQEIISKLQKAQPGLRFSDNDGDAEVLIAYSAGNERRIVGVPTSNGTMIGQPNYPFGNGVVLVAAPEKPKLVFSFHDQQNTAFERKPLNNFIKELIKLFKANK